MKNPVWNDEELILALDLYFSLSYGQMHSKNPLVIELSDFLTRLNYHKGFCRTPGSVSLKLANFMRIDPEFKGKGMIDGGKQEKVIWEEYAYHKDLLRNKAEEIKERIRKMDNKKYAHIEVKDAAPLAAPLLESFRDLGYTPEMAVADLIDNAIYAEAREIRVDFEWKELNSRIVFRDTGKGMTNDELIRAMRPGSQSPTMKREENDLGRFGLGLKTASFSQCRVFTVLSKKKGGEVAYWRWDIDYATDEQTGGWHILHYAEQKDIEEMAAMEQGTMVIWDNLDRIVEEGKNPDDNFYEVAGRIKRHIEMVFHRFLENGVLKIWFNGREVIPWDPFLRGEKATQPIPDEWLEDGKIRVKGYVLPHKSRLSADVWLDNEKNRGGWNKLQGFYVYRNKRLLLAADWLGLARKSSHLKLARIMVDLPNDMDEEWQIDIKKSRARLPLKLRQRLKAIMRATQTQAELVFRHRGKETQRSLEHEFSFVWKEMMKDGRYYFVINRDHPVIAGQIAKLAENGKEIEKLLRLLEETVPGPAIIAKENELPDSMMRPFEKKPSEEIVALMKELAQGWKKAGYDTVAIKERLLTTEPFCDYQQLIETLTDE